MAEQLTVGCRGGPTGGGQGLNSPHPKKCDWSSVLCNSVKCIVHCNNMWLHQELRGNGYVMGLASCILIFVDSFENYVNLSKVIRLW